MILIDARSPLSDYEKNQVRSATITPDLIVDAQRAGQVSNPQSSAALSPSNDRKKRFAISDTASDGGMTPKQLREWMDSKK